MQIIFEFVYNKCYKMLENKLNIKGVFIMTLYMITLICFVILFWILSLSFFINTTFIKKNESDPDRYAYSQIFAIFGIICTGLFLSMYFSLASPIDYVKKVNEQFIESGKLINSEKEAEKFKIINPEIRDSYKVNKNIKDINFKFAGNKLTTTLKNISCDNFLDMLTYLIKLKNTNTIVVNGQPASFILKSEANRMYECSNQVDKNFVLEVEFKS